MSRLDKIYKSSPVVIQNIFCSAYGLLERKKRFGSFFQKKLIELTESEWLDEAEIRGYQNENVSRLISHAYRNIPYYRELFQKNDLTPRDVQSVDELEKIPVLTKEDVRNNWRGMVDETADTKRLIHQHTSGSTGTALDFYHSREAIQFQWAVWWRFRERFGVHYHDQPLHCVFTGKPVVPLHQKKPPYWRFNFPSNQYVMNMQHIVEENIDQISKFLGQHSFEYYVGYPSIINQLCELLERCSIELASKPKFVFTGAEKLLSFQRKTMERVLGAHVVDQYGASEGCCNAARCEQDVFHEDFEFGVLRTEEDPRLSQGQANVLGTGFANYAMPFINYRIGDVVTMHEGKCDCGRHSRVFSQFDGRIEEYITTPENRRIVRFDYIFKDTTSIREAQIVQSKLGAIVIRIIKRKHYSKATEDSLRAAVRKYISETLLVEFEYVTEIERTATGKFRAVVNNLK